MQSACLEPAVNRPPEQETLAGGSAGISAICLTPTPAFVTEPSLIVNGKVITVRAFFLVLLLLFCFDFPTDLPISFVLQLSPCLPRGLCISNPKVLSSLGRTSLPPSRPVSHRPPSFSTSFPSGPRLPFKPPRPPSPPISLWSVFSSALLLFFFFLT